VAELLTVEQTKACTKCKVRKPVGEFSFKATIGQRAGKLRSVCKACTSESHRAYREVDLEKHRRHKRDYAREWRAKNPEKHLQGVRAYRARNREKLNERNRVNGRSNRLRRNYKMTLQKWTDLLESQKGKCRCCGVKLTETGKYKAVVDHCHKSGHVRGIICSRCNTVEGLIGTLKVARAIVRSMELNELLSYGN
jgi:hypothetical protein